MKVVVESYKYEYQLECGLVTIQTAIDVYVQVNGTPVTIPNSWKKLTSKTGGIAMIAQKVSDRMQKKGKVRNCHEV